MLPVRLTRRVPSQAFAAGLLVEGDTNVTMTGCRIANNSVVLPHHVTAGRGAGALFWRGARVVMVRSVVDGNLVDGYSHNRALIGSGEMSLWGGGLSIELGSDVTMINCSIVDNVLNSIDQSTAGAIYLGESTATLVGCVIAGNLGNTHGDWAFAGAMRVFLSSLYMTNCTLHGNEAASLLQLTEGGGMLVSDSLIVLHGVVFRTNRAGRGQALSIRTARTGSLISGCTFESTGAASTVLASVGAPSLRWYCELGQYMGVGGYTGNFTGCPYLCPEGFWGDSPYLSSVAGPDGCKPCPRGAVCDSPGTSAPRLCPAGTHLPATGGASLDSCMPCAPGAFNALPGLNASACPACAAGTFSEELGSTRCVQCSAGGYCASAGAATRLVFQPCPPGSWSAQRGATSAEACVPCGLGTASGRLGALDGSTCQPCRRGSYSRVTGAGECVDCAAGTYQDAEGQTRCKRCPRGYFCSEGASTPIRTAC